MTAPTDHATRTGPSTRLAYADQEPVETLWFDAEQAGRRLGVGREAMIDRAGIDRAGIDRAGRVARAG